MVLNHLFLVALFNLSPKIFTNKIIYIFKISNTRTANRLRAFLLIFFMKVSNFNLYSATKIHFKGVIKCFLIKQHASIDNGEKNLNLYTL